MTGYRGVAWVVPTKQRSKREAHEPPPEFGRRAVELAATIGKTREDILRATGRSGESTIARLVRGDGSMFFALAVKKALRGWGLDVSKLPSLGEEDEEGAAGSLGSTEEWLREWIELGERLHQVASEKRFQVEIERVRQVIRAHELVAEGTVETDRRRDE